MKALYITGFMGSGKTTIGKELAMRWNVPVMDTDEEIERKAGKPISAIFHDEGEDTFRSYESDMLQSLPCENVIITTGGGIVIREKNREWMKEHGIILYLYCDLSSIVERLEGDTSRPLFKNSEVFSELFETRQKWYEEATYTIDTTNKEINFIIEEIEACLKNH
ncbi:shikimate kinase [Ectobacillus sp. sgz5001026]|uniref:shikimate kinase n=1 Tax=Ectobacillus sp. sgz5001026 TaxID=3242473 RepID=UPI0036D212F4